MRVCKVDIAERDYDNYYYTATDDPDIIEVEEKADWVKANYVASKDLRWRKSRKLWIKPR